ncbi:hypothetical protein OAJ57_00195 [Alphaproteobacteria bacterium]|nr:hypothetical protein [Alphaproteobacteria bacterium]
MKDTKRRHRGSCHCGNIRFVFITEKTEKELPKRECQCSFCVQHGRISTSDADGEMHVSIAEIEKVTKYRFGHRTADFYVCQNCGAVPVVTSEVDGATIGLVDVRMIQNFSWSRAETAKHDFEGEDGDARLARRKSYWTGTVTVD